MLVSASLVASCATTAHIVVDMENCLVRYEDHEGISRKAAHKACAIEAEENHERRKNITAAVGISALSLLMLIPLLILVESQKDRDY